MTRRAVFYVSDSTGLTAEALGRGVLAQFEGLDFEERTIAFVENDERAHEAAAAIRAAGENGDGRPIVFYTFANEALGKIVRAAGGLVVDCLQHFVRPLEEELGVAASHTVGRSHSISADSDYGARIEAVNFALANDDGARPDGVARADIVLTGVSRTGKTPTSLYLALHYGVFALNYPLVEEDLERDALPAWLTGGARRLYGLSIAPRRLMQIRQARRPNSEYAAAHNCVREVRAAERLFHAAGIPFMDVTHRSVEEVAAKVLHESGAQRRDR